MFLPEFNFIFHFIHRWAFFVTFIGYFMSHFARKCYSTVKQQLQNTAGYSSIILSAMDTVFMGTYAAGNIISGKLGDTFNPTTILVVGLLGNGVCVFLIAVSLWMNIRSMSVTLGNIFIITIYFLFGFFQSVGDPVGECHVTYSFLIAYLFTKLNESKFRILFVLLEGTVVMGNWFCDKKSIESRGLIFGLWTCHQYLGDISAAVCTAAILSAGLDYTYALLIPACANVVWAYITMKLIADPADVDIITPEVKVRLAKLKEKELETGLLATDQGKTPITYATAIPLVANYALAYGFFKLTNYVLFFWLPFFLGKHFDPVTANLIASLYSVGMMAGGIIVGVVSDLFGGRRACVIGTFMGCLMIFLYVFSKKSEELSAAALLVMLTIMGILIGGPNSIITSAVAADLASHPSIQGNNKSLGTMTGLINGCGSITASVGLLAVGPLQEAFGWSSVWLFLMGSVFTGTALMGSKMYKELFPAPSHSLSV